MSLDAGPEEQPRLLEDALIVVRRQAQLMTRFLDQPNKLMDALKCASTLVSELRTSTLGPKQYYELYMSIFDALRVLASHLKDNHPVNHLADLYELVQYAGNIIPRLYLMITVGTVYMSIEDAPVREILKDILEMSRGVQQPIRGLFLRYYLVGQAKPYLPSGTGDGPEGNLQDSINFVLTNFVEMNKLWVRLQHQGHSRERDQRTKERKELQLLVGTNLERLSELVDIEHYKQILRPLLEQVVQCKDVLAQEYLLEVIIQVFPDDFHLHTLDQFLSAVARLHPQVNVKNIVIGLMDRLSTYATREKNQESDEEKKKKETANLTKLLQNIKLEPDKPTVDAVKENGHDEETPSETTTLATDDPQTSSESTNAEDNHVKGHGIPSSIPLFDIFYEQVMTLTKLHQRLQIWDTMALLVSLTNLALNIYPDRLDYINQILEFGLEVASKHTNSPDNYSQNTQSHVLRLLLSPIKTYQSLFTALSLPQFIPLLQSQPYPTRRAVAGEVARTLLKTQTPITTKNNLDSVLEVLKVIIREGAQAPQGLAGPIARKAAETEETLEEQGWLARLTHLIKSDSNDTQFELFKTAHKAFSEGNERIKFTFPPLIFSSLKLARKFKKREHLDDNWNSQSTALYKLVNSMLSTLYTRVAGFNDMALRLFVGCGKVADQTGHSELAYDFFAQAFTVYEEVISDSRAQFQAITVLAGALHQTRGFAKDDYDTLITKCALHGSKLLKKPDQCRAVYLASHLWWATEIRALDEENTRELYRDGKRVLECLQRALRVSDSVVDAAVMVELFVEVLNRYIYFFEQENESITIRFINGLIELIHSNLSTADSSASLENAKRHFERTLEYVKSRDYEGVVLDPPSATA